MKLKPINNKKGQMEYPIISFIVVLFGLIILSPFILKIYNSFVTPFGSALGNITEEAGTNVSHIATSFIGFWDFVIMIGFLLNIILLFVIIL